MPQLAIHWVICFLVFVIALNSVAEVMFLVPQFDPFGQKVFKVKIREEIASTAPRLSW